MGLPTEGANPRQNYRLELDRNDTSGHQEVAGRCQRCQALEARIAELESGSVQHPDTEYQTQGHKLPDLEFKALRLLNWGWGEGWGLRPSPGRRHWMDEQPHAYKCLPLVIANQWGWQILCPTDIVVTWTGDSNLAGLHIDVAPQFLPAVKSQFGSGIVTFSPPWLFRTPSGWDLYLKGPSNRWKPNCVPLEGVIETWWLNYTFTINWKIVEPGTVFFAQGESLGQLMPVPHATFRDSTAIEAPLGHVEPQAAIELKAWQERRKAVANQKVNVHHLYRKAEGIEAHIQSVDVPPIKLIEPPGPTGETPATDH